MGRERKREGQRGRASNGERAREKAEEVRWLCSVVKEVEEEVVADLNLSGGPLRA